jgi:hypothetical protein
VNLLISVKHWIVAALQVKLRAERLKSQIALRNLSWIFRMSYYQLINDHGCLMLTHRKRISECRFLYQLN